MTVEIVNLVKHYRTPGGDTIRAVDGISMSIDAGEMVALYGPSGSGKTTILQLVAGLLPPDSGIALVDGRDVGSLDTNAAADFRRDTLGFIRQEPDLMPGADARDNAALKLFDSGIGVAAARKQVLPLLEKLGLGERIRHLPHQLSVGERQRVLIARALSTSPSLLLADEPTGALDSDRSREVLQLLTNVTEQHGLATLLVTHDPLAASFATRSLTLRDGKIAEPDRTLT